MLIALPFDAAAQRVVEEVSWGSQRPESPPNVVVLPRRGEEGQLVLTVQNLQALPVEIALADFATMGLESRRLSLSGTVRTLGLRGHGFIQLRAVFPAGEMGRRDRVITAQTSGSGGVAGRLTGDEPWRSFEVVLDGSGEVAPPIEVEAALFMPDVGRVELGPLVLTELPELGAGREATAAERATVWIGAAGRLYGTLLAVALGGLWALLEWLSAQRRARTFVRRAAGGLVAGGVALIVCGIAMRAGNLSSDWWLPSLVGGGAAAVLFSFRRWAYEERFERKGPTR